jgi:predicted ArsR family transcriptional regulator
VDPDDIDRQLTSLAGLGDPLRRALYRHVAERGTPVSREDAAAAAGISRPLAAYHLDKLIDDGLQEARYQRRGGRPGPGAGRPAKHYVRAGPQIEVSLPARDYGALAELLAGAVEADASGSAQGALNRAASALGTELGAEAAAHTAADGNPTQALAALRRALASRGYEPDDDAWAPQHREYRASMVDNYGNAEVYRGHLDGDRLVFESIADTGTRLRLTWDASDPAVIRWRNEVTTGDGSWLLIEEYPIVPG